MPTPNKIDLAVNLLEYRLVNSSLTQGGWAMHAGKSPVFCDESLAERFHHHLRNDSSTLRRRVSRLKGLRTKATPGYTPQ